MHRQFRVLEGGTGRRLAPVHARGRGVHAAKPFDIRPEGPGGVKQQGGEGRGGEGAKGRG